MGSRGGFAQLGATPDLDPPEDARSAGRRLQGLSTRELQVLRLLAAGTTNHAIATDLVLAVETVDRHVSNIYAKLGVSSRAAAYAYEPGSSRHGCGELPTFSSPWIGEFPRRRPASRSPSVQARRILQRRHR
jgi:DNA-binding CsgD family transcriptional regulator